MIPQIESSNQSNLYKAWYPTDALEAITEFPCRKRESFSRRNVLHYLVTAVLCPVGAVLAIECRVQCEALQMTFSTAQRPWFTVCLFLPLYPLLLSYHNVELNYIWTFFVQNIHRRQIFPHNKHHCLTLSIYIQVRWFQEVSCPRTH